LQNRGIRDLAEDQPRSHGGAHGGPAPPAKVLAPPASKADVKKICIAKIKFNE
jgi:hypothetical protein